MKFVCFLGSVFTEDGKIYRELEVRTQKANAVSYQLAPLLGHEIRISIKAKTTNDQQCIHTNIMFSKSLNGH